MNIQITTTTPIQIRSASDLDSICKLSTQINHQHQQGIGKLLMDAATSWGEHHTVEMRLEVFDLNRNALAFYEHLGFSVQTHIMRKLMGETE